MGFSFNFFGESSHRDFNYRPRYYDPDEEERKRMFGDDVKPAEELQGKDAEHVPGGYIKGRFTDEYRRRRRVSASNRAQKMIGMVGLILFFIVLVFIVKFYGLILG